jgi:hypothetical protein
VALLLVFGLVACGGDEGDETTTTESAAGQTTGGSAPADDEARGGEASIEDFGSEAGGSEKAQIVGAYMSYMNAIAEEDYATACDGLSAAVHASLQQLVSKNVGGCTVILPKLLAPTAGAVARRQANGEITKVRVEDDRAFVIFRAPGAKLYQLTMVEEDGEWKASTVAASILVPDL